jgi:hypothetical protein
VSDQDCPQGGQHVEGAPQESGNQRYVDCTKCGKRLSTGMVANPADPWPDED